MEGADYTEPMPPHRLAAREAARRIERGELSVEALVRSCRGRIAEREPQVHAWTALAGDSPRSVHAPLFGVPIGVKDIFDTHDLPTEYGSPIYAGYRPRTDAAVVALARCAGGTILGKTVTAEFATFVPRDTRNPRNLAHTPGGSSSGSAAAVADDMVPLALGTQTAGSLIRPASYCGVVGYKPSFGVLPRAGTKAQADSLDTVGIFARSVEDAGFLAAALTGRAALDPAPAKPARIGVCRTNEWDKVERCMRAALEDAGRSLGAVDIELPKRFFGLRESHSTILWYELARGLADEFARFPDRLDPRLRDACAQGFRVDPEKYVQAQWHGAQCRANIDEAFAGCDVLLAPAASGEAPEGVASTGDVALNVVWTLLHVPCVAIPVARGDKGLPLGLQVIGRIGDDARTLAAARWILTQLS
jgi:Asp-tRNA(Asn)/Glu-tRNA(Gln) amidotransferase A subunit family amidase